MTQVSSGRALSAIVVNKTNIRTGEMDPETLKGFIRAARELCLKIGNEEEFLKFEQAKVFDWAANLQTRTDD